MKLQIKVTHKLLHNSRATDLYPPVEIGTIRANVARKVATISNIHGAPVVRFSKPNFDIVRMQMAGLSDKMVGRIQPIIRERVKSFLADSRYPISWNEDNCIETEIRELA